MSLLEAWAAQESGQDGGGPRRLAGGRCEAHRGDCLEVLKAMPDNSVDSVVTDPPYALVSVVKRFGGDGAAPARHGTDGLYARQSRGFMGKTWDNGDTAHSVAFWAEVLRVLKPGGYIVAFAGTRTYHRLACAIEDAGFEIRDMNAWLYGSGFPKSHDVSKGIDKAAGAERTEVIGKSARHGGGVVGAGTSYEISPEVPMLYAPATDEARQWAGWGTALKPALEPICLARKPLSEGTVAANVLRWGTGALNIDGCRIEGEGNVTFLREAGDRVREQYRTGTVVGAAVPTYLGRWPANVLHDGSDEVVGAFPQTLARGNKGASVESASREVFSFQGERDCGSRYNRDNGGSAARFFYSAKASKTDRAGSKHPTVKPVALMRWLCRLVTPSGGLVLDPFAGSGTTGQAAVEEGFRCVLAEREEEYFADIAERFRRMGEP